MYICLSFKSILNLFLNEFHFQFARLILMRKPFGSISEGDEYWCVTNIFFVVHSGNHLKENDNFMVLFHVFQIQALRTASSLLSDPIPSSPSQKEAASESRDKMAAASDGAEKNLHQSSFYKSVTRWVSVCLHLSVCLSLSIFLTSELILKYRKVRMSVSDPYDLVVCTTPEFLLAKIIPFYIK